MRARSSSFTTCSAQTTASRPSTSVRCCPPTPPRWARFCWLITPTSRPSWPATAWPPTPMRRSLTRSGSSANWSAPESVGGPPMSASSTRGRCRWRRPSWTAAASRSARWVSSVLRNGCWWHDSREGNCWPTCARRPEPCRASSARFRGEGEVALRERYVAAIDQGTASSRCLVFDRSGRIVSVAQKEHHHIYPRPGWVEHDPEEIWRNVEAVVERALGEARLDASDLVALGIANQRETTLVWDRATGQAVHNAINWQDTRTDHIVRALRAEHDDAWFRERSGLPPATYFSGPKLRWLLDTVPGLSERAAAGEVLFGTMDSWLIWRLTGRHLTDVTNASRTMMMGLDSLDWDDELLRGLDVPRHMLPEIRPSAETY